VVAVAVVEGAECVSRFGPSAVRGIVGRRRIASTSDRSPRPSAGGAFAHSREEVPGAGPVSLSVRLFCMYNLLCLQCFDAVGWAAGRASGL